MIKINLVAVGKVKESYFKEAIAEYSKRLAAFCKFTVIEVKEENFCGESAQIAEKSVKSEGALIMQKLAGYNIALAIEGEKISSEKLAEKIKKLTDGGAGEITFLIGGSYGLSDEVKRACNEKISFSAMTFPHTLARVIACEQVYRAFTIINGKEYHK